VAHHQQDLAYRPRSVAPRVVGSNPIAHPKPTETKTFTLLMIPRHTASNHLFLMRAGTKANADIVRDVRLARLSPK